MSRKRKSDPLPSVKQRGTFTRLRSESEHSTLSADPVTSGEELEKLVEVIHGLSFKN